MCYTRQVRVGVKESLGTVVVDPKKRRTVSCQLEPCQLIPDQDMADCHEAGGDERKDHGKVQYNQPLANCAVRFVSC